jgi:HemY protein
MKMLFVIAIALIFGASFIWLADFEPGFVLLQYGSWTVESTLIVLLVAMFLLFFSAYYAFRSLVLLGQSPSKFKAWNKAQKQKRASHALTQGLIMLEEGRWAQAERVLLRYVSHSDTPLLHYLAAARTAQKQNAPDRRDNYLKMAHESTEGADIAVGVVQAELQLAAGQKEQALATLQHLRDMSPKHPYILQLLNSLYQDMEEWQSVQAVLPDLRKRHVLENKEVKSLGEDAFIGQLTSAVEKQDWLHFDQVWQQVPARSKQSEPFLMIHVKGLLKQGEQAQALSEIEHFMRKGWSEPLIRYYGEIEHGDMLKRLATAETWRKRHPDSAGLLLTLGCLAKANKLWTKAEEYLEASLQRAPKGETYHALARVMVAQGKDQEASIAYKNGLTLMLEAN